MERTLIGLAGIALILLIAVALSSNRRAIRLRVVGAAFGLQAAIAILVLYVPAGKAIIQMMAQGVSNLLGYARAGVDFLFGNLAKPELGGFSFAISALPVIIFFASLVSILYYLGIMQFVVKWIGGGIQKATGITKVESLGAAANIFVGQSVTISYSDPTGGNDANAVQDIAGNDAISLSNQSVTNNSTQKQSQATLTLAGGSMAYGNTLKLIATGGSGTGAISYSVASGNCSIVNTDSLTATSFGTCTVTATKASDSNYLSATSSAATYTVTTGTTSATVSVAIGNLQFRTAKNISATASVSGKITFRSNNQIIAGCKNLTAVANVARNCSYRPNVRGYVTITVTLVPTDSSYQSSVTRSDRYFVYARSGSR